MVKYPRVCKRIKYPLILFLLVQNAYSNDLSFYREQYAGHASQSKKWEALTKQRLDQIRLLLGTEQKVGPFSIKFSNVLEHEPSVSYFFKKTFSRAIDALQVDATYGMPMLFDPSDSEEGRKIKLHDHKMKIFKETISDPVRQILDAFEEGSQKADDEKKVRPNLDQIDANTKNLVEAIQKYLPRTLEEVLGKLFYVDVIDGVASKLRFKLPENSGSPKNTISLTLANLINFKIEKDKYFLEALDLFLEFISPTVEEDVKQSEELKTALEQLPEQARIRFKSSILKQLKVLDHHIKVRALIEQKRSGALVVNQVLSKLTEPQLDFLLDLMLVLRGTDLPVHEEIGALSQSFAKLQKEHTPSSLAERDYQFYTALNDQLDSLEEFLTEKVQADRAVDKIIKFEKKQK